MNKLNELDSLLAPERNVELTASDIVSIVEACHKNVVHNFKYGSLEVSFFKPASLVDESKPMAHPLVDKPNPEEIDKSLKEEEEKFLLSETVLQREAEVLNSLVDDPEKHEDLVISGDLVDAQPDDK